MTANEAAAWLESHAIKAVALLMIFSAIGAGITGWLVYNHFNQAVELQGIGLAGPCRAKGIKYPECRRQARLILAACADQPRACAQRYGVRAVRVP